LPLAFLTLAPGLCAADTYDKARQEMIAQIESDMLDTSAMVGRSRLSGKVLQAMKNTPRHLFVAEDYQDRAYENRPLPIGYGQTISQPYIVALMTELIDPDPGQKTLEIGTGSGYQAAILSSLVAEVYTIEIVPELYQEATRRLADLKYTNVKTRQGDGYFGWQEQAPFDAIVVTAASDHIPPSLVRQLKPGGRMIIPIGPPFLPQTLMLVTKDQRGRMITRQILPVRFVPFTRSE